MSIANQKLSDVDLEHLQGSVADFRGDEADNPSWDICRLLWQRRSFVGRCIGIGTILALVTAFLIPPRYTSSVRLMPPDPQSGSMNLNMLASLATATTSNMPQAGGIAGQLLGGMKSSTAEFSGILQSRTAEDNLIDRFDLRKVYWVSKWVDARKILERRTNVSEDHKSGILTIDVTDRDPKRAAALAQGYVDELNTLVAQLSTSSARRERVFLEGRLKEVKQDLDSAAVQFSQFASKNTTIDMPAQSKAMVESAAALQGELIAAQSELSGLEQIYSSNNVRVRSLRARVQELQRQLDIVGGKDVGKEGGSAADEGNLYPSIRELPLLGVPYANFYRKVKIEETIFEILTKQYELAKVQEAKEIPTVRVLDSPDVPEKRSSPPRVVITVCGAVLGLLLATVWLIANRNWHNTLPNHPGRVLAVEVSDHLRDMFRSIKNRSLHQHHKL